MYVNNPLCLTHKCTKQKKAVLNAIILITLISFKWFQ